MYQAAPIHDFYQKIAMELSEGEATITLPVDQRYFHAAMAAHGSVYFKLLDDAAYFACQTVIKDYFIVTTSFNVQLLRPIKTGQIKAVGKLDFESPTHFFGSARLYDEKGRLCGTGSGQFVKSKLPIGKVEGYK